MVFRVWQGSKMAAQTLFVLVLCGLGLVAMAVLMIVPFVVFDALQHWAAS